MAFLLPKNNRCIRLNIETEIQQIQIQGGMTITNLLCTGFNHKIHQTANEGATHATPTQSETLKIKSVLAEKGKTSIAEIETPLFTKTLGGTT